MTDESSGIEHGLGYAARVVMWLSDAGLILLAALFLGPCLLSGGMDTCSLLNLAGPGHLFPALVAGSVLGRVGRHGLGSGESS